MAVEERRDMGSKDQFPIGMRVLAVDDDPICLKLLETLLLRCQYHVTTTNQAIVALNMLRENREQFDLVVSDVHMPDMDGFKLLELVGLEMDLPVIMLSANDETQAVMKGISHGAVDYLLKPVRLEELKNIWQHVIRRKKVDIRDKNNFDSGDDCDKVHLAKFEGKQGSVTNGFANRKEKLSKKRKDQNEDGGDDEEIESENDDPSSQKKPRIVWSVDLHRKFVAAVNQLGIDKAVPKRILDLMNVERLTRENVASHLQKYRLYLKRLSAVANQQANMVAALRGRDPSTYLPMASLDGYTNFNSLVGTGLASGHASFQPNGALPRTNNLTGFGIHGFSPSGSGQLGQLGRTLNPSNTINNIGKRQGSQHGFSNQSSAGIRTLCSDPFVIGFRDSSNFANLGRCDQAWQNAISSTKLPVANTLPLGVPFSQSDIRDRIHPIASQLGSSGHDVTSSCTVTTPLIDVISHPSSLLMTAGSSGDAKILNFGSLEDSELKWQEVKQARIQNSKNSLSNSSLPNVDVNNLYVAHQTPDLLIAHDSQIVKTDVGGHFNYKGDDNGFGSNGCSLDDLVNSMIKPEHDDYSFIDGDMGCNDFSPLGACI